MVEVVDVLQQSEVPWHDIPEKVLRWLKMNLFQREQASLYCTKWSASEIDAFPEISPTKRERILRDFEHFIFDTMNCRYPSKHEWRRGLRHLYRSAREGPEALVRRNSEPALSEQFKTNWREIPMVEFPILIKGVDARSLESRSAIAGQSGCVRRGRAECAPIEWKCAPPTACELSLEDLKLVARKARMAMEDTVADVLGVDIPASVIQDGPGQDVLCLEFARKQGLHPPDDPQIKASAEAWRRKVREVAGKGARHVNRARPREYRGDKTAISADCNTRMEAFVTRLERLTRKSLACGFYSLRDSTLMSLPPRNTSTLAPPRLHSARTPRVSMGSSMSGRRAVSTRGSRHPGMRLQSSLPTTAASEQSAENYVGCVSWNYAAGISRPQTQPAAEPEPEAAPGASVYSVPSTLPGNWMSARRGPGTDQRPPTDGLSGPVWLTSSEGGDSGRVSSIYDSGGPLANAETSFRGWSPVSRPAPVPRDGSLPGIATPRGKPMSSWHPGIRLGGNG